MPKKKKARAEMYWDGAKNRWRKRVTVDGRKYVIFGTTQDEVRSKIKDLEQSGGAAMTPGGDATLAGYCEGWYPVRIAGLRRKSAEACRNALVLHILPELGHMRLSEIKPMHVEALMAKTAGRSSSLQSKIKNTLNQVLSSAMKNGLIPRNPLADAGSIPPGMPAKRKTPLTRAQQAMLADAVKGLPCEIFTLLCLYAGLRREEALGLMWEDVVDLHGGKPYCRLSK